MRIAFSFLLTMTLLFSASSSHCSSRVREVIDGDVTERLETIHALKKSMKELNLQLSVYDTALEEAKSKHSHKKLFVTSKKVADAVTALTILTGAIASHYFNDEVKVLKIGSFIGGLSASTSVLSNLMADLSSDEAAEIQGKIDDLNTIIRATDTNLNKEIKLLCHSEPSNQMCL